MSEICPGCKDPDLTWSFWYCELVQCEGHWVCDSCGKAWDEWKDEV